ncbi:MAG TPA: HD domain-containing protein [Anaerolineaceae bacterium]|jgi:(p)ppGpp synthase/HD superfamily hydrolase|nr:HD domain-containing protein [Anaerolineaceae bacterium]HNZ01554.1 HD domain-containing protein [Anaerolineaceae bacterium]HOD44722.1 HD domain-containing protein [Anaerolineaceae bacterium]HOH20062.1 HD domain-containing protein [Anaerolineaceae bacterium]HQO97129.1 HD domain-containing protein [Anaerolineaceae bacterium]
MVTTHFVRDIRPVMMEFESLPFTPRTEAIAEAYRWGQELHAGQKRFSGEPYFETHCVWVAGLIDRLIGNEAWTIAALLHDAVEDRGSTLDQIRQRFPGQLGDEVAYIVDGVTKLSAPRDGRTRELETLRKIAMFRDPAVFLVKLADKTHNVLTLGHMPQPKRRAKAMEAIRAYGKLAGILNVYRWRRWLEDMAFPHADPETYNFVRERIDRDPRLQSGFINSMLQELSDTMNRAEVPGRVEVIVNGYWQAWQKLRRMARLRKTSLNSFSALNDLVSFRLVVAQEDASLCYRLLGYVNRYLGQYLDQDRFDDYIALPQNGYRALQVTGWLPNYGAVEVAIATNDMEGENLWGVVYAIKNNQDISHYRPVEILTPTGGARFVPEGSTVLDAVASIQQEFLLDKISAVRVNGVQAQLYDKVHPGDVVEVITSGERMYPTEEWLAYCSPSTARLIQVVLATASLRRQAEEGRQKVHPILAKRGLLNLEDLQVLESDLFDNLLERVGSSSLEDLYVSMGGGAIRQSDLEEALDAVGITCEELHWSTIDLIGARQSNRPGVLAKLAGAVSDAGGNILRSVNDTFPDGRFALRIVVKDLPPEKHTTLREAFAASNVDLMWIEIV